VDGGADGGGRNGSELTAHVMEWGGVGARKPGGGGVALAKTASRRARPLVVIGGGLTRLEGGVDGADAEADAGADAKRILG